MNMLSRPHPALVPTLTEVIEVGGDDQPPSASAMPGTATEVLPVQAMVPDGGAVQEGQLVQRVLTDVQRQIDSMLEFRLREALAPVLARHSEAIVRDLKEDLARTMRDVVARSVAQEVAKLRQR